MYRGGWGAGGGMNSMIKPIDKKLAVLFAWVFVIIAQVAHWGHPPGHSVFYHAAWAVIRGGLVLALTTWILLTIFSRIEKSGKR
jgi:hypothetical protein